MNVAHAKSKTGLLTSCKSKEYKNEMNQGHMQIALVAITSYIASVCVCVKGNLVRNKSESVEIITRQKKTFKFKRKKRRMKYVVCLSFNKDSFNYSYDPLHSHFDGPNIGCEMDTTEI